VPVRHGSVRPRPVVPGVYRVALGTVNAYILLDGEGPITVVDTGMPGDAPRIVAAVEALGRSAGEVETIVLTHAHADHSGGAAHLRRLTGAAVTAHPLDAALLTEGNTIRPWKPAPHPLMRLLVKAAGAGMPVTVEPVIVDRRVEEGEQLPCFGGVTVVHLPGHCAGQIGLHSTRHGGILLAGDVATNFAGLSWAILYEDLDEGLRSAQRVGTMAVEVVCLGHGQPLTHGAAARFRRRFGG
jgi:glyoxylase-like metal-dependent hydrolase (beta-lactamase superfamily II)